MKHMIVGLLTVGIIGLMVFTFMGGGGYHGGEQGKVIEDFGDSLTAKKTVAIEEKDDRKKENDKLNALRDKAGNAGAFSVSNEYKRKCASCHGVNGSGFQNGKPMMGPKIFGQSAEKLYKDLVEFKSGRKENVIMKGLLLPMTDDDLKRFADEIGAFPARAQAAQK